MLTLGALMLWLGAGQSTSVGAADFVDVTLRITRVLEVEDQDGAGGGDGDFFAQVDIDGQGFQNSSIIQDDDFNPDALSPTWRFTRNVDRSTTGPVDITIRLFDSDNGFAGAKDFADISPLNNDVELNIRFNPFAGTWNVAESDVKNGIAEGDGDHGFPEANDGRKARIEFQIFLGTNPDFDGDGIPDSVERNGVLRPDGSLAADLPALGANPCRKTILLEIDWMQGAADGHDHRPKDAAVNEIVGAFANSTVAAPPPCPYATFTSGTGVQLLIDRSNSLAEATTFRLADLATTRSNPANFDPARRPFYHYAVFAHSQTPGSATSGVCCSDGKDFIVSLGEWAKVCVAPGADGILNTVVHANDQLVGPNIESGPDRVCNSTANNLPPPPPPTVPPAADDFQATAVGGGAADYAVGTDRDQSGTTMHELGHSLGLEHRGRDDVNHSPNYLSNMNYFFQQGIPFAAMAGSQLDYSRSVLPTLTEASLDETAILDNASPYNTFWFDPLGQQRMARVAQAINWDQTAAGPNVRVDINGDSACIASGANGTIESTLVGDDRVVTIQWPPGSGNSIRVVVNGGAANDNDTCESTRMGPDDMIVTTGAGGTPLNTTCVGGGPDEQRDTPRSGDDVQFTTEVNSGPNLRCESTAVPDDIQVVAVGQSEPASHPGWDDWANLRYRAIDSPTAAGAGAGHEGDLTFNDVLQSRITFAQLVNPDLKASKTVDKASAKPLDTLNYTTTAENVGTGEATEVKFTDTKPLAGGVEVKNGPNIIAGQSQQQTFTYLIPCGTPNGTVLVNTIALSAKNLQAQAEVNTSNNTAMASTTVLAPVMTLTKTATPSVNAGEAITYRLTYANTGGASAESVVITDTLPKDVYYSQALDLGAGPKPDSVTLNADGTRTLRWSIGSVAAGTGPFTIEFTARPTLLALGGTVYENKAQLTFTDANGCVYPPVDAAANTVITVVVPTRDVRSHGYWKNHEELWSAELLARIQATDQRFDGIDGSAPNGALSASEVARILGPGGNQPKVLQMQLLATYFNLGARALNAGTVIDSNKARALGLRNVRDAALYGIDTLKLPVNSSTRPRYSDATDVLDEIVNNKSPRF
jgi:uncharacterized repeat protein (TIGR01451 family)